jgi:hypothetical protein
MHRKTDESENRIALGRALGHSAIEVVDVWKRERLELEMLRYLDVLQRRLKSIDDDEQDRRVNAITEFDSCLENWTKRRSELLVLARSELQPLYEKLEAFGPEGVDRLVLDRLQDVSERLHVQAHEMMFRELGIDPASLTES